MISHHKALATSALLLAACAAQSVQADPAFEFIRIGDQDSFGYLMPQTENLFNNYAGGDIDPDSDNILRGGDFLPTLGGSSSVATKSGDDFDNRTAETAGNYVTGIGFSDASSSGGSQYTDISLSTSYDASAGNFTPYDVYNSNTNSYGTGGVFPAPPSGSLTNQPGFVFDFFVEGDDIVAGTPIFFNLIFGDYDVNPADVELTYFDGSTDSYAVSLQGGQDGLVQELTLDAANPLDFYDVFRAEGTGWRGYVKVDFDAPKEPYTAFDFVELSVSPDIQVIVPTPTAAGAAFVGLAAMGVRRRRKSLSK